jgi:hypothetical protein
MVAEVTVAGLLSWKCRRHVGDMSATRRNVAYFRPDRPILATWFLVCRHTFVSRFPDIDGPKTDDQKERTN